MKKERVMNKIYHIFNRGGNVLFRTQSDYISANNKIAVAAHLSGVAVLAMSIMSNHLHIVAEADDDAQITDFASQLAKSYACCYQAKYGHSISRMLRLVSRPVASRRELLDVALYVIKNPIHHRVCGSVFEHRFGSGAYLFGKELSSCMLAGAAERLFRRFGDLSTVEQRRICRTSPMPDDWLVSADGMVMPFSYHDIGRARGMWKNNLKSFLYDMGKGTAEDGFAVERDDAMDLSYNRLTDIDVCNVIDGYAASRGLRSFHQFASGDRQLVVRQLQQSRVPPRQIARCLWME